MASAGASIAGAVSGSLSMGASASHKKTTTTKTRIPAEVAYRQPITNDAAYQGQPQQIASGGVGEQKRLTQAEADQLYEERMEDEYAKREGGA